LSNEWELLASYTLSKTTDDASDFDEQPANPYNLRDERALSRQDVRQRFVLSALFDLPFGDEEDKKSGSKTDLLDLFLSHIEIAPIATFTGGRPVNALTGADENRGLAFPLAARPQGFTRNNLHSPGFINFDLRALKYIPFGERRRLDLVVEIFNLFNRPTVAAINPFYGSNASSLASFGAPVAFAAPRQVRFSIDFEF